MKLFTLTTSVVLAGYFIITGAKAEDFKVTDDTFKMIVLQSKKPVMVIFCSSWSSHCRILGPVMDSISSNYNGLANFAKIDIFENPVTAENITSCIFQLLSCLKMVWFWAD